MPDYDLYQLATHHNSLPQFHDEFSRRQNLVNNTPDYYTGDSIKQMRSIQMVDNEEFDFLFGNYELGYARQAIEYFQNRDVLDPGQLDISMMLCPNFYSRGRHLAVFLIHLYPHRQFYDGHVVQIEFDHNDIFHQRIETLFDTETRAVVEQATEYKILSYVAEEAEMLDLLNCFLVGFNPMKFSFDEDRYYVDPEAEDNHRPHACCDNEIERIMRGFQEIDQLAGADAEINQGFIENEEDIYIIHNDFIFNENINDYNRYINHYIYNEPEQNFRVQG